LNRGLPVATFVIVAVADVFLEGVTVVVTTAVGADVGIDETLTCVILTVYTFSMTDLVDVSVFEFIRYPHVPSEFL
jgi:hypothetical protein